MIQAIDIAHRTTSIAHQQVELARIDRNISALVRSRQADVREPVQVVVASNRTLLHSGETEINRRVGDSVAVQVKTEPVNSRTEYRQIVGPVTVKVADDRQARGVVRNRRVQQHVPGRVQVPVRTVKQSQLITGRAGSKVAGHRQSVHLDVRHQVDITRSNRSVVVQIQQEPVRTVQEAVRTQPIETIGRSTAGEFTRKDRIALDADRQVQVAMYLVAAAGVMNQVVVGVDRHTRLTNRTNLGTTVDSEPRHKVAARLAIAGMERRHGLRL